MKRTLFLAHIVFLLFLSAGWLTAQDSTYTEVLQIAGRGLIYDIQWSPVADVLAVSSDQGVWLYTDSLEDIKHLPTPGEFDAAGWLVWSPDGTRIFAKNGRYGVIGQPSQIAYAWDVETAAILFSYELEERTIITDAAWQPGGSLLALLILQHQETNTSLVVIDSETGSVLLEHLYEGRSLNHIAWNEDGTTLSVTEDLLRLTLDAATGDILETVETESLPGVQSPDGSLEAIINRDGLQVLDTTSGQIRHTFEVPESRFFKWNGAYWNQDGSRLVSFVQRGSRVVIFDTATGDVVNELQFHPDTIISALDVRGGVFAISFLPGTLELYDIQTGAMLAQRWQDMGVAVSLAWSPDGSMIVTAQGGDPIVRSWDAQTGQEMKAFDHQRYVFAVAWSPDGRLIAAGDQALLGEDVPTILVWDFDTGEVIMTLPVEDSTIGDMIARLEWSPDSRVLVATRPSNHTAVTSLRAWDTDTGELVFQQDGHFGLLSDLSPNGELLAVQAFNSSFENDGKDVLQIWDIAIGAAVTEIELPDDFYSPRGLVWHPSGQWIAAGDDGNSTITLWDVNTGVVVNSFEITPVEGISTLSWHPDGEYLAVRGYTGEQNFLQLWSISETGGEAQLAQTLELNRLILTPLPLVWSPDGTRLAIGTNDGAVIIMGEK